MHTLKSGFLHKTGKPYALVLLPAARLEDILALENTVRAALPEDQKRFLKGRGRAFFGRHFAKGNLVLGVESEGRLIAQSLVVMNDGKNADKTVLQGVVVDPAFRGNHLMQIMIAAWFEIAAQNGKKEAFAKVSADNRPSLAAFASHGMFPLPRLRNNKCTLRRAVAA